MEGFVEVQIYIHLRCCSLTLNKQFLLGKVSNQFSKEGSASSRKKWDNIPPKSRQRIITNTRLQLLEPGVTQAVIMFSGQLLFHTSQIGGDILRNQEEENHFLHNRFRSDYLFLERSEENCCRETLDNRVRRDNRGEGISTYTCINMHFLHFQNEV